MRDTEGGGTESTFIHIHLVSCHEHRQAHGVMEDQLRRGDYGNGHLSKTLQTLTVAAPHASYVTRRYDNKARKSENLQQQQQKKDKYSRIPPGGTERLFCSSLRLSPPVNLLVHASGTGIISSDVQPILGTCRSAVHEKARARDESGR